MKGKILSTVMSASVGFSALATTMPVSISAEEILSAGKVIYSIDFEDGDVSMFTNRGENDTTEISVSDEASVSGSKALLASGRSNDWNGPAFRLDDKLEPFTEYYISAKVKGRYYTGATFSFQYTNSDGETKYSNLVQNLSGSDWMSIENVKVSFTDEMTGVYVYFEGGQDDLFIDDFVVTEAPSVEIEQDIPGLKDVFANDFKIGTAFTPSGLSSKPTMNLIEKHFSGSITAGNEMKPDAVLNQAACLEYFEETGDDTVPQISFSSAKPLLNYCRDNNIPVRIHTLVWHSQTPDWFFKEGYDTDGEWVSKEKMLQRMENYIKAYFETLTELYPTVDFYACDVVNEAWTDQGTPRQPGEQGSSGSEKSAWVQVFGDNSFIEPAFTFAKKYAPKDCKLYYNDYNEYMDGKLNAICQMAADFKEKGIIDGIGMQSHLDARQSLDTAFPSVNMYNKALDKYSALGLDIQVTELDATVPENSEDQYFDVQADYYKGIIDAIVAHKDNISAVIFWGITDDGSWRAKQQPLLFDSEYKAKPAFYSIVEGREIPPTTDPITSSLYGDTNEDGEVNLADAVLIMQNIANPSKYKITEQGKLNGDVDETGDGITSNDAFKIQQFVLGIISSLDPDIL